jgi:ribosomal protein S18 acetylase RimI-like enzyme
MTLTLRPATPSDVPACAAIAHAAFAPSPLIHHVAPTSEEVSVAFWSAVISSGVDGDPNAHVVVAEDTSQSPAVLLGLAKWVYVPAGAGVPGIGRAVPEEGGGGGEMVSGGEGEGVGEGEGEGAQDVFAHVRDPEMAKRYFAKHYEQHEKFMGARGHWYLELISTKREVKGLGTGRKLVEWGLEKVDADGCEAYLEASPEGRGLFERFGFRVVERLVYLDGAYVECSMMREGKKGTE